MVSVFDGDRSMLDHGENVIVTPLGSNNCHNFGPVSARDSIVHTCARPGGDNSKEGKNKIPTSEAVSEWIQFMTDPERNIRHVIILLSDEELEAYDDPVLIAAYQSGGITVHHIPYNSEKSYVKIMSELEKIEQEGNGNVTAHCTHGMGRSGRVAAGWLVHRYGLTVEDAVEETLAMARKAGVERMGSLRQLAEWISD
jgi:protein tyrosine/serine phosphatase